MRVDRCVKLRRLRINWRAFAKLLKVVNDDEGPSLEPAFNHPALAVLRAKRHIIQMNGIVCADGVDLLLALRFSDRKLRNQNSIVHNLLLRSNPAKLSGAKYVAGIWERSGDANRAGLRIQLAIDKGNVPLVGIDFTIR